MTAAGIIMPRSGCPIALPGGGTEFATQRRDRPPQTPPAARACENLFVFQFSFFRFPFPGRGGITAAKVIRRACFDPRGKHPSVVREWPGRMGALDNQQERA
ncbi:hypothetical protein [Methylorubrum aminovorans]|uniref:hypothetical protein n=1 Tax=Methylorubrum aminovorans TaxID=269069 RepID=UPI001EDF52A8|nr:hypothetical protein [Methylorubrum aminovorans]